MEAHLVRLAPLVWIDVVGGLVGFLIALGWWKASGRTVDRDAVMFIAKLFGGIACLGIVLAFIM